MGVHLMHTDIYLLIKIISGMQSPRNPSQYETYRVPLHLLDFEN